MKKRYFFLAVAMLCNFKSLAKADGSGADPHSFSQPDKIVIRHLDMDLKLDFENEQIRGSIAYVVDQLGPVTELILDSSDMTIETVSEGPSKDIQRETVFNVGEKHPIFGSPLVISIQPDTKVVTIKYQTAPKAGVLSWLSPNQTLSGKSPFFFTKNSPIRSRTWMPCQDTPTVRMTYSARVQVPKGLLAVMTAANPQEVNSTGIYEFEMKQAIPSYLIALAVGELQFRPIGEKTGIYANPLLLEKASKEFEDLPKMMEAAEELFGPYLWDRYDVLLMPNAFPSLGMENPRLSFFYPGIVTGDKSEIMILAHELAHSWSGNLITNSVWGDFWLNEGFTTFLERKILEKVYGQDYADLGATLGLEKLKEAIAMAGSDLEITKLHADLTGRDPSDIFNKVPYEKGHLFLKALEEQVGQEKMISFLKNYFKNHQFKSISTKDFIEYLKVTLFKEDSNLEKNLSLDEWINSPGMPSRYPEIHSDLLNGIRENVKNWLGGASAANLNISTWKVTEKSTFLSLLPKKISLERLRDLEQVFEFSSSNNLSILQMWIERLIVNGDTEHNALIEHFLKTRAGGTAARAAIYKALIKSSEEGRKLAERIYAESRDSYHPTTRTKIEKVFSE